MEEVRRWFEYMYSHYQLGSHIFSPTGLGDEQVHGRAQFCHRHPENWQYVSFSLNST